MLKKIKYLKPILWITLFALGIWTIEKLQLANIYAQISALTFSQWFLWGLLNAFIALAASFRWWLLLSIIGEHVDFLWLTSIRQAGQAVNFITPGPQFGSEPLQLYWLKRAGLPLPKALLSIGLDRAYELLINFSVLIIILILLLTSKNMPFTLSFKGLIFIALCFAFVSLMTWLILQQPTWLKIRLPRLATYPLIEKLNSYWQLLTTDFKNLLQFHRLQLLFAVIISFVGWAFLIGELAFLLSILNVDINVHEFLLLLLSIRLALLLPIPGGLGTLEASVFWFFHSIQSPTSAAVAFIALIRLRDCAMLMIGLLCLSKFNRQP